ncbi:MAG: hypothetical protein SF187_10415 [Deltaproteobacteria bacterium]|nr:hypothetical protein [Deltaproteobacteria bacterium]
MTIFFLLSGVLLIVSGVLQAIIRPRGERESTLARILNRSTLRAVVFVCVGLVGVLVGVGVLHLPRPPGP